MYLTVDNHKTHVATGGKEFDASLPTVLFVHGTALDHRCWALQTRWFAFNGFSVLAPDLPGHSLSEGDALTSIEAMGAWLAKLIEASGAAAVHVVGHSQGFLDAMELYRQAPAKVLSITGVATSAAIPVNPALLESAASKPSDAAAMLLMWGFGENAQLGTSAVPGMQPIAIGRRIMASNPIHADLEACSQYDSGETVAETVKIPAHIILARRDRLTPYKAGLALAEKMNATVSTIEDYGHMLPMEAPRKTLDKIKQGIQSFQQGEIA